jgi:hypothetical protein
LATGPTGASDTLELVVPETSRFTASR